jgi:hypothetical protein
MAPIRPWIAPETWFRGDRLSDPLIASSLSRFVAGDRGRLLKRVPGTRAIALRFVSLCVTQRVAPMAVALLLMAPTASATADDNALVTITGGAEDSRHHYSWVVTNRHTAPIVRIEFPHYKAYLFFVPDGWSTETTALVHIGVKDAPGVCTAKVDSSAEGIAPGESATFRMQVGDLRAKPLAGSVRVKFADGREASISGVELPTRGSKTEKYVPLIGLGLIFATWVLIANIRRRRSAARVGP